MTGYLSLLPVYGRVRDFLCGAASSVNLFSLGVKDIGGCAAVPGEALGMPGSGGRAGAGWPGEGVLMAGSRDQRSAVRDDLDVLVGELHRISGSLEEVATAWRRAGQFSPGFPAQMQQAAGQLINTVRALAETGQGQPADLAASAVAQMGALKSSIASSEAQTRGMPGIEDSRLWAVIGGATGLSGQRLRSLLSHLGIEGR